MVFHKYTMLYNILTINSLYIIIKHYKLIKCIDIIFSKTIMNVKEILITFIFKIICIKYFLNETYIQFQYLN